MAPKKAAAVAKDKGVVKPEVPQCALCVDSNPHPYWDDGDVERESWGDLNATTTNDPNTLFVDPDFACTIAAFGTYQSDLKRPSAIFSPFKPVVFRPAVPTQNPYDFDPEKDAPQASGADEEDDDAPLPKTREEMVSLYRTMKQFRVGDGQDDGHTLGSSVVGSSPGRRNNKKKERAQAPTPLFMRAYNSALMIISQYQRLIPEGHYAWELIYPKVQGTQFPQYNPTGKYAVKLFFGGAFRKVIIDDRLPTDTFDQSILTVTDQKEIWPALLVKAMLKALGPSHEQVLLKNPMWTVTTLMHGWTPQILRPITNEIETLGLLRNAIAAKKAVAEDNKSTAEQFVVTATCGDAMYMDSPTEHPEEHYTAAGLQPGQLYSILDVQPYHNTSLLRMCGYNAQWKGTYQYGNAVWTPEFEQYLNFSPALDRNKSDLTKKWFDFWISWENFEEYFGSVAVLRNVNDKRYREFRQVQCIPDPVVETKAPAKGAAKDAPPPVDRTLPKSFTKFMHFNVETNSNALITFSGIGKSAAEAVPTAEGDAEPTPISDLSLTIHRYKWDSPSPFSFVNAATISYGTTQTMMLRLPQGTSTFRLQCDNVPVDSVVAVACPVEFTLGDEGDVMKEVLGLTQSSDAGVFGAHPPKQTTTWFKRLITVKEDTTVQFFLDTLPKGTDLAKHKTVAVEAPVAAGKGKAPAKPAKGAPVASQEVNDDEIDDTDHETPILNHAHMRLFNLDTMEHVDDTVGKIMDATLTPNKAGWLLIGFATPRNESYGKGYWKVTCTSSRPFDTFESRAFEELTSRNGDYVHNDYSSLFRYNFTVAEAATATIQLCLSETWAIPFELKIYHNEKQIVSRNGMYSAFIEHINFTAPEKGANSVYAIHCKLDDRYTSRWEEGRREQVVQQFRSDCLQQEKHLIDRSAMLRELLQENPEATIPDEGTSRPGSVIQDATGIHYDLLIHCGTAKVDIKEDNSIVEQLNAVKASWAKSDEPEPNAKDKAKKPAKGQPVVDEGAVRQQKAKESREKFMANRRNMFVPYVHENKVYLSAEDEPLARMAPLLPEKNHVVPHRLHGGIVNGSAIHGGNLATSESEAALTAPQPPAASSSGAAADTASNASPPPSAPSAEQFLAAQSGTKPQIVRELDELVSHCNLRKEHRKMLQQGINESLATFWNDENPGKAMAAADGAEDDKKKGAKKK